MSNLDALWFRNIKFIETQIDEFLNKISEGGIYFEMGIDAYLFGHNPEDCEDKLRQLSDLEDRCQELRRAIATELYTEMLIPDARGDVLSLLQDLYYIADTFQNNYQGLLVEKPQIPEIIKPDLKELTNMVIKSVEMVIVAAKAYFRNPPIVRDYIHKVSLYESEADRISLRLKKIIFETDLPLENKLQLRYTVDTIDQIANNAEDVSDWLAIFAIKRVL